MKRRWMAVWGCLVLMAVSVGAGDMAMASPKDDKEAKRKELRDKTDLIIREYGRHFDEEYLDREMGKLGWKKGKMEHEASIQSATSCGTAIPDKAYYQGGGLYDWLVLGKWQWNDTFTCVPGNDSPMMPEDALAMGVTDYLGNPVDSPAVYANGNVYDQSGTYYSARVVPNTFTQSSVGYSLADEFKSYGSTFIGHHGTMHFYFDTRPSGTSHYLQVCWKHNWNTSGVAIDSVTVKYPWAVEVKFVGGTVTNMWAGNGACQKSSLIYN